MNQINTINKLKEMFINISGLNAAILYGSFGRKEGNPNSDIDIQLLVDNTFESNVLIDAIKSRFKDEVHSVRAVVLRNKVVVYRQSQPKMEFAICTELSQLDKNYLGSEIIDVAYTILFENVDAKIHIANYLESLLARQAKNKLIDTSNVEELVEKFLYEFESCSTMHRRSDGYQFYFFYNIALHVAIQLKYLSLGIEKFSFLPKYFASSCLNNEEQVLFKDLKATLFLPEANQQKRRLLDFFYEAIHHHLEQNRCLEVVEFCEWVYSRDFFWNFRDVNAYNPKLKSGIVYRTATLTFFQNEERFDKLLIDKKIKTIVDLRANKEIMESPYSEVSTNKFKYVVSHFDPWNQPDWFKENHRQGTNEEIAYRFFAIGCKEEIKTVFESILHENEGSVAIHCFAGKDRTGIVISLLHLLLDTPLEWIYADYLASEVDVKLSRLNFVMDIIQQKGGIEAYLIWCGLTEEQITALKTKLTK